MAGIFGVPKMSDRFANRMRSAVSSGGLFYGAMFRHPDDGARWWQDKIGNKQTHPVFGLFQNQPLIGQPSCLGFLVHSRDF
jgi:hypothetical protein